MSDRSVFFSYTTDNREQVAPYLEAFKRRGIDVWIDFEQIAPGQSIAARINAALAACSQAVVFHSVAYAKKVWTQDEMNALIHMMVESNRAGTEQRTIFVVKLDPTELPPLLRHRLWTAGEPDKLATVVADKLAPQGAQSSPDAGLTPTVTLDAATFLADLDGVALEQLASQLVPTLRAAPIPAPLAPPAPFAVNVLLRGYGRLQFGCMSRPVVDSEVEEIAAILKRCGIHRRFIRGFQDKLASNGLGIYDEAFRYALDEQIEYLDVARLGRNGLRDWLVAVILTVAPL